MSKFFVNEPKRMILFDLNGTLIDEKASRKTAFIETLEQFTARWSLSDPEWDAARIHRIYEKEYRRRLRHQPKAAQRKLQVRSLQKALQPYPIHVDEFFAKGFFGMVAEQRKVKFQLFADTIEVLEQLAQRYQLGIISNSRGYHIESSKLQRFFPSSSIVTPANTNYRKPDSRFYHFALKKFGQKPEACVMIGNSWKNDIVGAAKVGIDGIWVRKRQNNQLSWRKLGSKKVAAVRSLTHIVPLLTKK